MTRLRPAVAAAMFVAVALAVPHAADARGKTVAYAIVIGNNNPPPSQANLPVLRYADDDAVELYQLFSRFADSHLLTVLDRSSERRYPGIAGHSVPPSLENLRRVVAVLATRMAADRARGDRPILYFAFSGHGGRTKDGGSFLALTDARLTQERLYDDVLDKLPAAYTHVIIDACHAGGVVGVRGGFFGTEVSARTAPVAPERMRPFLESKRLRNSPTVGVLIADTTNQEAYEWSRIESGVFTHELISGLLGAADVNGDGKIEYTEVQAFVASANRDIPDPSAVPQVIARPPPADPNVPLISLGQLAHTRFLEGNASRLGHFYIELANGERYLDAHLAAGVRARIAIPASGAVFVRTATREARVPPGAVVSFRDLSLSRRVVAARGAIDAAYRTTLFSAPYGRSYYQGFVDSTGAAGVSFRPPADVTVGKAAAPTGHKRLAIGLAATAGAAAVASVTTGILAYLAKRDFDATNLQKPAYEARIRYDHNLTASVITGAAAVVAGAAAWWVWPRSQVRVAPAVSMDGHPLIGFSLVW